MTGNSATTGNISRVCSVFITFLIYLIRYEVTPCPVQFSSRGAIDCSVISPLCCGSGQITERFRSFVQNCRAHAGCTSTSFLSSYPETMTRSAHSILLFLMRSPRPDCSLGRYSIWPLTSRAGSHYLYAVRMLRNFLSGNGRSSA
jgi:hypothetical protein